MSVADDLAAGLAAHGHTRPGPMTRKDKLQAELKVLEWHKMANNAAIKAALIQTNTANKAENKARPNPNYSADDSKWIKNVIQQEHIKPLEVSKDFVLEYEAREKENQDRLTTQVQRHISTLKTLRKKLEDRNDLKSRSEDYRQWQKGFLPKKNAIMLGKTLAEVEVEQDMDRDEDADINDKLMKSSALRKSGANKAMQQQAASSQELNTVLDSLNRLQELESRITSLETDNKYDLMTAKERPTADQRQSFEFKRNRSVKAQGPGRGPVGVVYNVSLPTKKAGVRAPANTNRNTKAPQRIPARGAARGAQGSGRGPASHDDDYDADMESSERGGGIFITGVDSGAADKRTAARRERGRQLATMPAGQKNVKSRVQAKVGRQKEQKMGAKRHEEAMKELARRKQENSTRKPVGRGGKGSVQLSKGAGGGVRTKNKHLQEFENMKRDHGRRKEAAVKLPKIKGATNAKIGNRFISQTAPAYSNKDHPYHQISTKKVGTTTRRTNAPTRRGIEGVNNQNNNHINNQNNNQQEGARQNMGRPSSGPPAIAVTGMGGLRVLRDRRNPDKNKLAPGKPPGRRR